MRLKSMEGQHKGCGYSVSGHKSNVISERLSQENISVKLLNEMLRVMNYKVVVMPREARIPEGGHEIE